MGRAHLACTLGLLLFAARANADEVAVTLDDSARDCRVHGSFVAPVSPEVAWSVLSDYDHIDRFVRSMVSSHAVRAADGSLRVDQVAVGGVFFLRRRMHVVLETHEEPGRRIAFRDVLAEDFASYAGEWLILPRSGRVEVGYRLAAEPRGTLARAMCRGALRRTARELLGEVRAEMLRRQGLQGAGVSEIQRADSARQPR
jgi:hypothetical protein